VILNRTYVGATATAMLCCVAVNAQQATYPTRPVRIIVGFLPGSSNDTLARFVGLKLGERFGQQIVVDNRPGANGIIGGDLTAKANADGHTLLLMTHPSFAANNVKELIDLAKTKPNALTYSSAGTGGINHFGGALFSRVAGVQLTHVPYKGGAPALTDVMAGQISMMWGTMPLSLTQIRAGKVKALGITSTKRSSLLPSVPTITESGAPGYEITTWWGMLAPAAVPAPIVSKLNTEINSIVTQPDSAQRLAAEGAEPWPLSSAAYANVIQSEIEKWTKVAREAGIRAD
jgi:tripartite-type tricarboxylate transporter receptor subunit TctC